jgi:diguanylate cyclase (GGDEF)-like protein/PAS domain S-box-containing protein
VTSAFDDDTRANDLYRAIVETSPYFYCVLDADARFTFVSTAAELMLGYEPASLIGEAAFDYVHPDDMEIAAAALTQIFEEFDQRPGEGVPIAMRLIHADGSFVDVEVGSAPMLDDPVVRGIIIRARPMSGQQFLDRALEALVASSPLGEVLEFLVASLDHELTHAHATLVYDWDGETFGTCFTGGLPDLLVGGTDEPSTALWQKAMTEGTVAVYPTLDDLPAHIRDAAAAEGQAALWIAPVTIGLDGAAPACIGIWRDVPGDPWVSHQVSLARAVRLTRLAFERRRAEELLLHAALHDTLTGVANRAQFFDRLGAVPAAERRHHSSAAILYLDLDGFKSVNDTYGHKAGDLVLQTVTDRMLGAVRASDLVARLGGDEFAVLCIDIANTAQATGLADRLIAAVAEPIDLGEGAVHVGVSIGIALAAAGSAAAPDLLEMADRALYEAKREGKSCWRLSADSV